MDGDDYISFNNDYNDNEEDDDFEDDFGDEDQQEFNDNNIEQINLD